MNKSLRKTIIIISLLASLLVAFFAVFSIISSKNALEKAIISNSINETIKSANQMSMVLEGAEKTVDALVSTAENSFDMAQYQRNQDYVYKYMKQIEPTIKNALANLDYAEGLCFTFNIELVKSFDQYEIWYVYNENGDIEFLDAAENGVYIEAFEHYDAGYMEYYFNAIDNRGGIVWIGPVYDPDIKKNTLTCSKAVYVNNLLVGVIGIDISTQNTTDMIMDIDLEEGGEIALFNQSGKSIVDSFTGDDRILYKALSKLVEAGIHSKNQHGFFQEKINGKNMLITYSSLSNGWLLTVTNNETILFSPITFLQTFIIVLSALLIVVLVITLYMTLTRYNRPMEEALRNKDIMLAHQSRLAQAGKIMTNIAHQWKQPLNNINLIQGNLWDEYKHGEMTEESLENSVLKTQNLTHFMSETIDNFNQYLKPEKEPSEFIVDTVITAALMLITDQLKKLNIILEFVAKDTPVAFGYPNAFYHAILNIITNAIDASENIPADDRIIKISSFYQNSSIVVTIFNKGLALSDEVKEQAFIPYFTTKAERGTGLGLSITKNILEENMHGNITLENKDDGVNCIIIIPMEKKNESQK